MIIPVAPMIVLSGIVGFFWGGMAWVATGDLFLGSMLAVNLGTTVYACWPRDPG